MFFELRIYDLAQGRAQDMSDRMTRDLIRIFGRNDVPLAGAWTIEAGMDLPGFAYLMAHSSPESAAAAWMGFYEDSDWHETRERTNAGSELVERGRVINANPLSQIAPDTTIAEHDDPAEALILFDLLPSTTPAAAQLIQGSLGDALRQSGAAILGAVNVTSGLPLPTLGVFARWPDANARRQGDRTLNTTEVLRGDTPVRGMSRLHLSPLPGLHAKPGLTRIVEKS